MKILFVSRMFHEVSGGVERMAIMLMNELIARGIGVELVTWDNEGAKAHYELNKSIVWHKLAMGDARKKASWGLRAKRQLALRRLLKSISPDVVIAFQHGPFLTIAVAGIGLSIPMIAAERNAPQRFEHLRAKKWRNLIFQSFRLARRITVQFDQYVTGYPAYLRSRIVSIANPVPRANRVANPGASGGLHYLLSVSRLSYQKNPSVLIRAFAIASKDLPDWSLRLVGGGEDQQVLEQLVRDLGLDRRVEFVGAVRDVESYYATSHLFCLASRWEGFPNAMAEAMAHGLPVVAFGGCAGMSELIEGDKTGKLAKGNDDVEALAEVLVELMRNDDDRVRLGQAALAAMRQYEPKTVFMRWEELFRSLARGA